MTQTKYITEMHTNKVK